MQNLINAFEHIYPGYLQKTAGEIMEKTANLDSPWYDAGAGLAGVVGHGALGAIRANEAGQPIGPGIARGAAGGLAGGVGGSLVGGSLGGLAGYGAGKLLDLSDRDAGQAALLGYLLGGTAGGYGGGVLGSRMAQQPYLNQPQA